MIIFNIIFMILVNVISEEDLTEFTEFILKLKEKVIFR